MIYLLEDDDGIRELLVYTLNSQGMPAQGFARPSLFWSALNQSLPELILLDIMLPEEDGLSVLKRLRSAPATSSIPIMMLTAKGTEYDKVIGLDGGADDYVAKPFGMMELLARIRALLRRSAAAGTPEKDEYCCATLRVDLAKHLVSVSDSPVSLTQKEFELLCLLLKNRGNVLSRSQILDRVWGYAFDGESRTVDVHIRSLRQKLGAAGNYIETVRGYGYRIGGEDDPT